MMFTVVALTPMLGDVGCLFSGLEAVISRLPGTRFNLVCLTIGKSAVGSGFGFRDDAAYRMFIRAGHGGVMVCGLAKTVKGAFCERDLVLDEADLAFKVFDFLPPFVPAVFGRPRNHTLVAVKLRSSRFGIGELLDHGLQITAGTGDMAFKG